LIQKLNYFQFFIQVLAQSEEEREFSSTVWL